MVLPSLLGGLAYAIGAAAFALPWMVKCQYHDILNTVGALVVVVLGGMTMNVIKACN